MVLRQLQPVIDVQKLCFIDLGGLSVDGEEPIVEGQADEQKLAVCQDLEIGVAELPGRIPTRSGKVNQIHASAGREIERPRTIRVTSPDEQAGSQGDDGFF
jgi:hypothetical protein